MHLQFQRSDWLQAVQQLNSVIDKKNTIPVVSMILLETDESSPEGSVRLSATNLETSASFTVPAHILDDSLPICLPGKNMCDILTQVHADTFDLTTHENFYATLTTQTGKYTMCGLSKDEFPYHPTSMEGLSCQIAGPAFAAALQQVLFAISTDESRYALTGVYFEPIDSGVVCVATDGHRLSKSSCIPCEGIFPGQGILPARAGKLLKKMAAHEDVLTCAMTQSSIMVRFSSGILASRLIDATFPNYRAVIPDQPTMSAALSRDEYQQKLRQVLLAGGENRLVRHEFHDSTLRLSTHDDQQGKEAQEVVSLVDPIHAPFTIGFNGNYVLDALAAGSNPTVTFFGTDALSPGLFQDLTMPEAAWVVMPMRV